MDKKKILLTIMIVATVGFVSCAGVIIYYYVTLNKHSNEYEQLAQQVTESKEQETVMTEDIVPVQEETQEEALEYVSPIDFDMLKQEENKDIYAWLKVDGTQIDYPVLQHPEDDSYYVVHNLDGSFGYPGCVFSELYNKKDFEDSLTVLYGHNMKNGSMFAGLHNFKDQEFFDKHGEIIIYTPDGEMKYEVFAAFVTNNKRITAWIDINDEDVIAQYIQNIYNMNQNSTNHVKKDITVNKGDKILALETCVKGNKAQRYLVLAVRKNNN